MAGSTLPERVAQIYYTYGLFSSSYPITAITLALSVVLLCCFPLLNVPLPGNIPATVVLPLYEVNNGFHYVKSDCSNNKCPPTEPPFPLEVLQNETQKLPHVWAKEKPLLYVQQIIMKIGVSPWTNNLKMWDAFRAPLQEAFRLLETVRNHEDSETKTSLAHRCFQIEGIKRRESRASVERLLPEYGCLLLSPANLWQQNLQTFSLDANILNTIHNYHKGKVSISEMAFGMHLRDTGVKRYPLRRRPRVLQYAVTVFFEHYDQRFLQSLSVKLREQYPLYQDIPYSHVSEAALIYYPGQFNYRELVPLIITFFGLFLYVYFSVRKIEFINSKFGLAACAVTTIAGSLAMSMGICFYFGFSLSLQGKEIFPYLVIIVGLENVLVLTKSVTGTDARLDVKIRLAQGLSKEGWSITKNLLTEITIFTVSFFTFVPFIQEFSIFMIVSLLSDYFVQMVYFATILGIDVRRNDYFREQNSKLHLKDYFHANNALNWRFNQAEDNFTPQRMTKSKSHPRLNGLAHNSPTDVVAKRNSNSGGQDQRVPKRIRLVNLWARTRFFQRAFMVWMIVWISMIVYNSDIVDYFIARTEKSDSSEVKSGPKVSEPRHSMHVFFKANETSQVVFSPLLDVGEERKIPDDVNDTILLKHSPQTRPWSRLPPYHWSSILSQYNQSVAGRYAVVLPPLLLSHRVSPELAASVRNPDEKEPAPLRWQALAAALDPIDIMPDFDLLDSKAPIHGRSPTSDLPIYPTTPMEILLLAILCSISVAVIAYMMVVLYRCICSRHYAEWRASWNGDESYERIMAKQPAVQLVMEAVPIVVSGHIHEVECIATDGEKIVSSCLQGNVKVWDSQNGDSITNIDRARYFKLQNDLNEKINSMKESSTHDIEEVTLKQDVRLNEKYPRLRKGLDSHLSGLRFRTNQKKVTHSNIPVAEKTKYEFAKNYRELYCSSVNEDYYSNCETKDNLDISSNSINNKQLNTPRYKDSNSNESSYHVNSRVNSRKVNGSVNNSEVLANSSEVLVSNSDELLANNIEVLETSNELSSDWSRRAVSESPVWCMDLCNDLIVLGCADGRLEFWEANRGKLLCVYWSESRPRSWSGVTHVRALGGARRVVAASLSGHVTLLRLHAVHPASGAHVDWRFSTAHRPTHKRTGSAGAIRSTVATDDSSRARMSFSYEPEPSEAEEVSCFRVAQCRAHQQPITELQAEGGRLLTGGQDHVLKVFSSSELSPLFTLHGHCGPITSSFIDHTNPNIAGSGSQDGLLCVWDLHTGACLYSTQAHDGSVSSLAYTASYVISAGSDERLCIWDRFQGHMLNSVHIGLNYMSRMLPLTHSLLVMGDRSGLVTYDLSSGDVIRRVLLSQSDGCIFVRQILPLKDAIVCDYANQLRIVRFPLVSRLANIKND